jgi:Domain of unknown function (DUF4157)
MRTFAPKQNQPSKSVSSILARPDRATSTPHHFGHDILHLQRRAVNQAAPEQTHAEEPEGESISAGASRFAYDFSRIPVHTPAAGMLQAKLSINTPGDAYEHEADAVAEQVTSMATPPLSPTRRQIGAEKLAQRETTGAARAQTAPLIVDEALRSPSQPLDAETRAFMEPRFGHDFSRVRIHTGNQSASSTLAINALAYTVGQHIVFGAGQYEPTSSAGRRLLAHELAHVIQQSGSSVANSCQSAMEQSRSTDAGIIPSTSPGATRQPAMAQAKVRLQNSSSNVIQRQVAPLSAEQITQQLARLEERWLQNLSDAERFADARQLLRILQSTVFRNMPESIHQQAALIARQMAGELQDISARWNSPFRGWENDNQAHVSQNRGGGRPYVDSSRQLIIGQRIRSLGPFGSLALASGVLSSLMVGGAETGADINWEQHLAIAEGFDAVSTIALTVAGSRRSQSARNSYSGGGGLPVSGSPNITTTEAGARQPANAAVRPAPQQAPTAPPPERATRPATATSPTGSTAASMPSTVSAPRAPNGQQLPAGSPRTSSPRGSQPVPFSNSYREEVERQTANPQGTRSRTPASGSPSASVGAGGATTGTGAGRGRVPAPPSGNGRNPQPQLTMGHGRGRQHGRGAGHNPQQTVEELNQTIRGAEWRYNPETRRMELREPGADPRQVPPISTRWTYANEDAAAVALRDRLVELEILTIEEADIRLIPINTRRVNEGERRERLTEWPDTATHLEYFDIRGIPRGTVWRNEYRDERGETHTYFTYSIRRH